VGRVGLEPTTTEL